MILQKRAGNLYAALPVAFFAICQPAVASAQATPVFINETHYENTDGDINEFVEVAGPAGTNLTDWSIEFYNGSNGQVYATEELSGTIPDVGSGFGMVSVSHAEIQNGAPDGLALVNSSGNVVQFLSYEGIFEAQGGPADGMTSEDIGVAESDDTGQGDSLQLTGTGAVYEDFTWTAPASSTPGSSNTGQTLFISPEPANHPADFTATVKSASRITTGWTDSVAGAQAPDGYLILCGRSDSFADPTDGTAQSDDTDCADGSGAKSIAHGSGATYTWTNLTENTAYYFKIFPYTNSGPYIDYKTDGTPSTATATTPVRSSAAGYSSSIHLLLLD